MLCRARTPENVEGGGVAQSGVIEINTTIDEKMSI